MKKIICVTFKQSKEQTQATTMAPLDVFFVEKNGSHE